MPLERYELPDGFFLETFPATHTPVGPWEDIHAAIHDAHGKTVAIFFVDAQPLIEALHLAKSESEP